MGDSVICAGSATIWTDATPGGTWGSSDPDIATVDASGLVTGVSAGTTFIGYTVPGCPFTTSAVVMLTVTAAKSASTAVVLPAEIALYPNPATGSINVKTGEDGIITIYSLSGTEAGRYPVNAGINAITLSPDVAAGVYLCRFTGMDGNAARAVTIRLVYQP